MHADGGPASLYDPTDTPDSDLWFLPQDSGDVDLSPLPRADRRVLFDRAEWLAAQGALSGELAGLALLFGALEVGLGAGLRHRLALQEAAALSWWAGTRMDAARLALWVGQHAGGGGEDGQALAQAGWAVRKLGSGPGPDRGGWGPGLAAFLGHASDAVQDVAGVMATMAGLHPVTQGAVLFGAWRVAGQGPGRDMEAAVLAARLGGAMGRTGTGFLPLALAGVGGLQAAGPVLGRLAAWIRGAEQSVLAALMQVEGVAVWRARAQAVLADQSGRTPGLLVDLLAEWPMVSAPLAEEKTGASRAAVQRNLDRMAAKGLIREVTGQGRYRVWTANV